MEHTCLNVTVALTPPLFAVLKRGALNLGVARAGRRSSTSFCRPVGLRPPEPGGEYRGGETGARLVKQ